MEPTINVNTTSTRIAWELLTLLGRRKAAWVRTRISQALEAEDGRRQGRRGRDRVRPNALRRPVVIYDFIDAAD
jgi:hypothetical protein